MQIHLSAKQFAAIALPFTIFSVFYLFEDEIFQNVDVFFPKAQEYSNATLSKKVDLYLQIEKELPLFEEISSSKQKREPEGVKMAQSILFEEQKVIKEIQEPKAVVTAAAKEENFKVEVIFLEQRAAVIDGVLLKIGEKIKGAKLLEVQKNRVLIDHTKGKQWLYMFQ